MVKKNSLGFCFKTEGLFFILLWAFVFKCSAQKETYTWPFGFKKQLVFHSGFPVFQDSSSKIHGTTFPAALSDCQGNLLFYTAQTDFPLTKYGFVFNSNNDTLYNGILNRNMTTLNYPFSQNYLVKGVNSDSLYYLLYTGNNWPNMSTPFILAKDDTLYYSIINKNYHNGQGKLIQKNVSITDSASGATTIVTHSNGTDYWLINKKHGAPIYKAYLISDTGIAKNPIVSIINGSIPTNVNAKLKPSPNGFFLAFSINQPGQNPGFYYRIDLLKFDPSTSQLSLFEVINLLSFSNILNIIGHIEDFEFSPNNKFLFVKYEGGTIISQINLSLQNVHPFKVQYYIESDSISGPFSSVNSHTAYSMNLSPFMNKIYLSSHFTFPGGFNYDKVFLSSIEQPNNPLPFFNFQRKKLSLGIKAINGSLDRFPMFPQGLLKTITFNNSCSTDTILFSLSSTHGVDSIHWNFGDSAAGALNLAHGDSVFHKFTAPGNYTIYTTVFRSGGCTDSIVTPYIAQSPPLVNLPIDTFLCVGDTLHFEVKNPPVASYFWHDSVYHYRRIFTDTGKFVLQTFNDCGFYKDSVFVKHIDVPQPNLGKNTGLCVGDTLVFNVHQPAAYYVWHNADSTPSYSSFGFDSLIWVQITNPCGVGSDSVLIRNDSIPYPLFGNDTAVCYGQPIPVSCNFTFDSILWNNKSVSGAFSVTSGTHTLAVHNACGVFFDTLRVDTILPLTPIILFDSVTTFCDSAAFFLDVTAMGNASYLWTTGDTVPVLHHPQPGWYGVTVSNACGTDSALTKVKVHESLHVNLPADTGLCSGSLFQLNTGFLKAEYDSIIWNGFLKSPVKLANPGTHTVAVYNACGVFYDTSVVTSVNLPVVNLGADTLVCDFDSVKIANKVQSKFYRYLWNTGQMADSILVTASQLYAVTVSNSCGSKSDSVWVDFIQKPLLFLGNDTVICAKNKVNFFNHFDSSLQVLWFNSFFDNHIVIDSTGWVFGEISNACYSISDSVFVLVEDSLNFKFFPKDSAMCANNPVLINLSNINAQKTWFNGSTTDTVRVNTPQLVWVQLKNTCNQVSDSIRFFDIKPVINPLLNAYNLCSGDTLILNTYQPFAKTLWSNGSMNNVFEVTDSGVVQALIFNRCGDSLFANVSIKTPTYSDSLTFEEGLLFTDINKVVSYSWFLNNQLLNFNQNFYLPQHAGLYHGVFIDSLGCVHNQYKNVMETDLASCNNWAVYPNPVSNKLNFFVPQNQVNAVKIYAANGNLVYQVSDFNNLFGNSFFIDVQLAPGVYLVQAVFENCVSAKRVTVK